MKQIMIMSEQQKKLSPQHFKTYAGGINRAVNFTLAKILARFKKDSGVILPTKHIEDMFQDGGFNCIEHQEIYFEFKNGSESPIMSMASSKSILTKSDLAIFEPTHFDSTMERSLLYAYLNKIETIVLLSPESIVSDLELLGFADYIITTNNFKGAIGRKATIVIDPDKLTITGIHDKNLLLHIQLPQKFKGLLADAIQPFTAGFVFALSKGGTISGSIKIGIAIADIALEQSDTMPSKCDTAHLYQNYDQIAVSL